LLLLLLNEGGSIESRSTIEDGVFENLGAGDVGDEILLIVATINKIIFKLSDSPLSPHDSNW
jgi:hypothetical protein